MVCCFSTGTQIHSDHEFCSVFHYLTYEGAVDIESITDPHKRLATELTIAEFGQTPAQLLRRPHPPRNAYIELTKELSLPPAYRNSLVLECSIGDDRIVWLACRRSDIVCLEQSGHVKFLQIPFVFNPSPTQSIFNSPSPTRERIPSVGSHTISGAGSLTSVKFKSMTHLIYVFLWYRFQCYEPNCR